MTATGPYSDGVGMGGAEPGLLYSLYSPASQSYPPPHHQYCAPAGFYPPHPVPLITRSSSNGSQAGVRTIILTGFPSDVKDRELNNLLLFLPGYQGCRLVVEEGGKAEGRALFASSFQAQDAMGRIDGTVEFDKGFVLKATMATDDLELESIDSPRKVGPMPSIPPIVTSASTVEDSGSRMAAGYVGTGYISPTSINGGTILPFAAPFGYPQPGAQPHIMTTPRAYAPVKNEKDNPPCNTLFIGNLGESVNENELRCAFGPQPGFQQLKVVRGPRGISAFIEFADVTTAAAAHETQQGLILASSDRGPIRVQFSKNPFGRKRDGSSTINGGMLISPQAYGTYALPMTYPAGAHPGQSMGGPGPYYSVPPPVSGPLHGYHHHGGLVPAGMAMQSIEAG